MYTQAVSTSLELCLLLHHHQSPTPCPCSLCCLHNVHVHLLSTSTSSPTCMWLAPAPLATYMTRACSFILPELPCFLQPLSILVGLLQFCVSPYLLHVPCSLLAVPRACMLMCLVCSLCALHSSWLRSRSLASSSSRGLSEFGWIERESERVGVEG